MAATGDTETAAPSASDDVVGVRFPPLPAAEPDRSLRYRRHLNLFAAFREFWAARHITRTLAERWLLIRYKQAWLGIAWAVITPLIYMLAFSLLFHRVAKVNTGGVPYSLYVFVGLLPWMFFSSSVAQGGMSLITNIPLLNKVYCPREVFPVSYVLTSVVDFGISVVVLIVLFIINSFMPTATSYWIPVLLAVLATFTIAVTLAVSSLIVYLRDLRQMIPMLLQIGIFATPVAWNFGRLSSTAQDIYSVVNPLAPVIDGLRRSVLQGLAPRPVPLALGAAASVIYLLGAFLLFKRLETGLADVA